MGRNNRFFFRFLGVDGGERPQQAAESWTWKRNIWAQSGFDVSKSQWEIPPKVMGKEKAQTSEDFKPLFCLQGW